MVWGRDRCPAGEASKAALSIAAALPAEASLRSHRNAGSRPDVFERNVADVDRGLESGLARFASIQSARP